MSSDKTIALIFPDGTSMRNWMFSSFLKRLTAYQKIVVFSGLPSFAFDELDKEIQKKLIVFPLENFREPPLSQLYRYAKLSASLHWNNSEDPNPTFFRNFPKFSKYSGLYKLMLKTAWKMGERNANQTSVLKYEDRQVLAMRKGKKALIAQYQKQLENLNIDFIFNVHQREVKVLPVMLAAKNLGLKTINFVYSWDNLPKGRMAVPADDFFVWSDYMQAELEYYYPDISENRIHVTGTPQFEFYHTTSVTPRIDFAKKHGLNPDKQWLLYSGDMTDASPFDQHYLEDVYLEVQKIPEKSRPQIVFRNAPVDQTDRFKAVLAKYPEIIHISPLWRNESEHERKMVSTLEDTQLLVNLCFHCKTAINFGSTMALDFAQFDKKVLYLNYNHPQINSEEWTSEIFYRYTHFESMNDLEAVYWVNHKSEILEKVTQALKPKQDIRDLKLWENKVSPEPQKTVEKILKYLSGFGKN